MAVKSDNNAISIKRPHEDNLIESSFRKKRRFYFEHEGKTFLVKTVVITNFFTNFFYFYFGK